MARIQVVGLTARGWSDLPDDLRAVVREAEVLLGSARHLDLVPPTDGQERARWPVPLRLNLPGVLRQYADRRVVALASGDPLVSGIGSTLVELLGAGRVAIHPAISSVALARARLGWSAEQVEVITVVGRDLDRVRARLAPDARLIILSAGAETPGALAGLLISAGYGQSRMVVLGNLGADDEQCGEGVAQTWSMTSPQLNVVAVECVRSVEEAPLGLTPGLPDGAYEHDGQLTKRDVRALALSRLAPQPGELLWDLGAGAGSVGIEWCRTHPRCRAVAIEQVPDRAVRIARNAARLGVPDLQVVATSCDHAVGWLPEPDAIFVGGGGDDDLLRRCWQLLKPGGRLVAHAVTLETEEALHAAYRARGGELSRLSVETMAPLGRHSGWRPARAVVQWAVRKSPEVSPSRGGAGGSSPPEVSPSRGGAGGSSPPEVSPS